MSLDSIFKAGGLSLDTRDGLYKVFCGKCNKTLGIQMPCGGPNGQQLTAIGSRNVTFETTLTKVMIHDHPKSFRWREAKLMPLYRDIAQTHPATSNLTFKGIPSYTPSPIVLATSSGVNLNDSMRWKDLLDNSGRKPRLEQLRAFRRSLMCNHFVIMPTGAGKTLIAGLIMRRMQKLNPNRIALMLVDRIPLVEQQLGAIMRETGLIMGNLCSETSTSYNKINLFSGAYEGIVATAGALYELLINPEYNVSADRFSVVVFDECHHLTGGHVYMCILRHIMENCGEEYRPRLVGLSASPCTAKSTEEAKSGLVSLRESFGAGAGWYRPLELSQGIKEEEEIKWVVVDSFEQERCCERDILQELEKLCKAMDLAAHKSLDQMNKNNFIIGEARYIISSSRDKEKKTHAERVLVLLEALEINELLGPFEALPLLNGSEQDPQGAKSAQLVELERRLDEHRARGRDGLVEESSRLSGIIFVETRRAAARLTDRLKETFPEFKPRMVLGHRQKAGVTMTMRSQAGVVKDFREGDCRLIVSTSVLEEGLDVQGCNAVFRIGARASLIQLIQSRGRARAKAGTLTVILNESDKIQIQLLLQQQRHLDQALIQEAAWCKTQEVQDLNDIIQTVERELGEAEHAGQDGPDDDQAKDDDDSDDSEGEECIPKAKSLTTNLGFVIFLTVDLFQSDLESKMRNLIFRSIRKSALVHGSGEDVRIEFRPGQASSDLETTSVFRKSASTAIVSVPTGTHRVLQAFANFWDFQIEGAAEVCFQLPPPASTKGPGGGGSGTGDEVTDSVGKVKAVSVGYFVGFGEFEQAAVLWDGRAQGDVSTGYSSFDVTRRRKWTLKGHFPSEKQDTVIITAPITTLGTCVFMSSARHTQSITVFLHVTSTPSVLQWSDPRRKQRIALPPLVSLLEPLSVAQEQLRLLAGKPVLAIEFDASVWGELVSILADPSNLGLPALVMLSKTLSAPQSTEYKPGLTLLEPITNDSTIDDGASDDDNDGGGSTWEDVGDNKLLLDVRLAFLHLESNSNVHLALHPKCVGKIFRDLQDAIRQLRCRSSNSGGGSGGSNSNTSCAEGHKELIARVRAMQELPRELTNSTPFVDAFEVYEMLKMTWLQSVSYDRSSVSVDPDAFFGVSGGDGSSGRSDQDYFMIDRAIATPSRVIFKPAILMKSSRLMRMLAGKERIVYVKFADEAGQALYNQDIFKGRFRALLDQGIVDGAQGLNLQLLVSSASQMREQKAVFLVCHTETGAQAGAERVERIRRLIIPDGIACFGGSCAKYVSRLGQFCTGDSPFSFGMPDSTDVAKIVVGGGQGGGVVLPQSITTTTIHDLTAKNRALLTDGAGFISPALLATFLPQLKAVYPNMMESATCCLQIRYRGSKGVLAVSPGPSAADSGVDSEADIILRESMVKWKNCPYDTFCVVTPNRYNRLRLNRDVLNILFSLAGEGPTGGDYACYPEVAAKQERQLETLTRMLTNHDTAREKMRERFDKQFIDEVPTSSHPLAFLLAHASSLLLALLTSYPFHTSSLVRRTPPHPLLTPMCH